MCNIELANELLRSLKANCWTPHICFPISVHQHLV